MICGLPLQSYSATWDNTKMLLFAFKKQETCPTCLLTHSFWYTLTFKRTLTKLKEGLIEEVQQKYEDAATYYERALLMDAGHKDTLTHLGIRYFKQNNPLIAEKYLTAVITSDPTSHDAM